MTGFSDSFPLPGGGRLVLGPGGTAVERLDAFGLALWTCRPTDDGDAFVALDVTGDEAVARTWRGVDYRIGLNDGGVRSTTLVK